jgi:hypothetical protein
LHGTVGNPPSAAGVHSFPLEKRKGTKNQQLIIADARESIVKMKERISEIMGKDEKRTNLPYRESAKMLAL